MAQGCKCFLAVGAAVAALALAALAVLLLIQYKHPTPPRYYASIVSVSGIGGDQQRQRMQFAVTLGVESRSPLWRRACLLRGMAVVLAYHGVPLAFGATGKDVCAGPWPWELWTVRKTTLVARRSGMVSSLPEFVVQGLVADMQRGVQVFDVMVQIPTTRQDEAHGDDHLVEVAMASCMARLVRDDKADACQLHYLQ